MSIRWAHMQYCRKYWLRLSILFFHETFCGLSFFPASILYKSIADRYRPVSYPDGPITARYKFIKTAYLVCPLFRRNNTKICKMCGWLCEAGGINKSGSLIRVFFGLLYIAKIPRLFQAECEDSLHCTEVQTH